MASATCLILYIGWAIVLGLILVSHRGLFMLDGTRRINQFSADNKGLSDFGERLACAHANCLENLPIAASLLLYAIATDQTALTDMLAMSLLGLRIAQSLFHLSGTHEWQVTLRLGCYLGQIIICIIWMIRFLFQ